MTKALYDGGREAFAKGEIAWLTDDIRFVGVTSGYTFSAAHNFLSDVGAGTRVFTTPNISAGRTATAGVLDIADFTQLAVTGAVNAIIWFKNTGVEGTSRLIGYTDEGTNIPLTLSAQDLTVAIDNGANKLAKL